jgi:hypothetical protein
MMDIIAIIAATVNLMALGGFAWWIVGWLRSLKGAVDAQRETISAQKEFIQGLQTVLDASDTPKMLERLEAYKKFVDQEKEASLIQAKRDLAEVNESAESSFQAVAYLNEQVTNLVDLVGRLMPFLPPKDRPTLLDSTDFRPRLKDRMIRLAHEAPDLSRPEVRRGLVYAGHLIKNKPD